MYCGTGSSFTFQACVGASSPLLVVSGHAVGRTVDFIVVIGVVLGLVAVENLVVLFLAMPELSSCDWSIRFMKVILLELPLVRTRLQYRCTETGLQYNVQQYN